MWNKSPGGWGGSSGSGVSATQQWEPQQKTGYFKLSVFCCQAPGILLKERGPPKSPQAFEGLAIPDLLGWGVQG